VIPLLTVNLAFSSFVFWLAARLYLLPRLGELNPQSVLLPILLLHAFRHLGLMFLAPGAIYAGMPPQEGVDLIAAIARCWSPTMSSSYCCFECNVRPGWRHPTEIPGCESPGGFSPTERERS
jgi:hypothetical protein